MQSSSKPPPPYTIITHNPKNRCIQAPHNLKQSTLILQSQPLAIAVLSSMRNRFCNFCLKEKSELLRCTGCATLFYCSNECQKRDWPVHKQECKRYGVLTKGKGHKITADFVLLVRCWILVKSGKGVELDEMIDLNEFQSQERREHFQAMAVVIAQNFELQKSVQTMSLLTTLANKISVNAFTIQDYLFNHDGIAIGLYHPANYFNHSCSPNAVQVFDGRTLKIIALESIEKDDQIFISYIDELLDQNERVKILRESYLFDCGCYHCMAEKAIRIGEFDLMCVGGGCGGKGRLKGGGGGDKGEGMKGQEQGGLKCGECGKEYSKEKVEEIRKEIKELKDTLLNPKQTYEVLIKSFFSLRKMLRFANPYFAKILQNLYVAALSKAGSETDPEKAQKYYRDAYKILKSYVDNFKTWYKMLPEQQFHPLLLWKYSQLGKLAMYLKKIKKAMIHTQKAIQILKKTKFSQTLQQVKDLKQRYNQLVIECRMYITQR